MKVNHNYIVINKTNLINNFLQFSSILNKSKKIILVIKANAYGHGVREIVSILKDYENQFDAYQIDDVNELAELRLYTSKKALVLGYIMQKDLYQAIVELNGTPAIYDIYQIKLINEIGYKVNKQIPVHICIDSYLGRDGILFSQVDKFLELVKDLNYVKVEGFYSHFANIEDTSDRSHAELQIQTFKNVREKFLKAGLLYAKSHISATSGILEYEINNKSSYSNYYVRLGIGLYGIWPSKELKEKHGNNIDLQPVMEVKSIIAQIKHLPQLYPVGYGITYITSQSTKVAIIPFGYSDGIPRLLSNKGNVLINSHKCPIIGRISMNMMTVNINELNSSVQVEDSVTILGKSGEKVITAEEIAAQANTINYEILVQLGREKTPRVIVEQ